LTNEVDSRKKVTTTIKSTGTENHIYEQYNYDLVK